jgi:serine/threonine-protein kinase ATR
LSSDVLLNYVEGMHTASSTVSKLLPFAAEASWATGRWAALEKYTSMATAESGDDFNISVGQALLSLYKDKDNTRQFKYIVGSLRQRIVCSLSNPMTASLASSHDPMLKLHVLTELEMIAGTDPNSSGDRAQILQSLNRRLEVIGAYLNDKQYLLGIRRAAMKLSR